MQHHSGKFFVICIVASAAAFVNMQTEAAAGAFLHTGGCSLLWIVMKKHTF